MNNHLRFPNWIVITKIKDYSYCPLCGKKVPFVYFINGNHDPIFVLCESCLDVLDLMIDHVKKSNLQSLKVYV